MELDCEIYVNGLSVITEISKLKQHFAKAGEVLDCWIFPDRINLVDAYTFGFVRYTSYDECVAAVDMLHNTIFMGNLISVKINNRNKPKENSQIDSEELAATKNRYMFFQNFVNAVLFIGNLPLCINEKDLYQLFNDFPVLATMVARDAHALESKGYGYVCFECKEHMLLACKMKQNYEFNGTALIILPLLFEYSTKPIIEMVYMGIFKIEAWNEYTAFISVDRTEEEKEFKWQDLSLMVRYKYKDLAYELNNGFFQFYHYFQNKQRKSDVKMYVEDIMKLSN